MPDLDELKAALERLIAGTATEADRDTVRTGLSTGVVVTGENAVAIGGDASDVSIAIGDQIVFSLKGDAFTALAALRSIIPTRLHQVPPPPADFTGRADELKQLLTTIERGGVTISGLQGLGGIGKTAFALKLVEQLKPYYPDAQFYLDLKGASAEPLSVTEALGHVIRSYHPAAKLPESETELRALYLSVLDGQRAILLMDNAADAVQVEPLIPPASCLLLVTSRWHSTLPGFAAKNLDTLMAGDARALLLTIAPRIGEWADKIAALCGYLPLALRLAASALAKYRNLKPADYAARLQHRQRRLQLIEAPLSVSYELLSEELQERWRWLAVFTDSFDEFAAAAVWEVEVDQALETLGELITESLIELNETSDRYHLHDLSRLFADAKLNEEERAITHKRHAMHYMGLLAGIAELYLEGGEALLCGLALFDHEWNNIQAGQAWAAAQGIATDENVARLCISYPGVGAEVLSLRQHARGQICWLETGLAAARRLKDPEGEAVVLGNLGLAYAHLGKTHQALHLYEQQLTIVRELGDRMGEGIALGNIGLACEELGETQRAITFFEQRLTVAREIGDRRGEASALGYLGGAYVRLGEDLRAIQFYEQQLTIVREIGDLKGESVALGNLGIAHAELDDTQKAIGFFEEQLAMAREIGDLGNEGIALWNMSLALDRLGKRPQAIELAEQSLTIHEQIEDRNAMKVRVQLAAWRAETSHD